MFKIYKKTIIFDTSNPSNRLESIEHAVKQEQKPSLLTNLLAVPALLVAGVASVVFFSAFFAILLIPAVIVSYKFWRRFQKMQQQTGQDIIDAEYTVVEDESKWK